MTEDGREKKNTNTPIYKGTRRNSLSMMVSVEIKKNKKNFRVVALGTFSGVAVVTARGSSPRERRRLLTASQPADGEIT